MRVERSWSGFDGTANRLREQRLRQAGREHAELLNIRSDGVLVWELDVAIQYWNEGAEKLYGFSSAEPGITVHRALSANSHTRSALSPLARASRRAQTIAVSWARRSRFGIDLTQACWTASPSTSGHWLRLSGQHDGWLPECCPEAPSGRTAPRPEHILVPSNPYGLSPLLSRSP